MNHKRLIRFNNFLDRLLEASGYDEAIELSKSCPHLNFGGTIELREIEGM